MYQARKRDLKRTASKIKINLKFLEAVLHEYM